MINRESDTLMIGYGGMLMETVVSVVALIAACSLFPGDYYAINVMPAKFATLNMHTVNLAHLSAEVGENVAGRPGGAVSLAVGFAQIFAGIPWLGHLLSYWYHFAIMFEALFILTAIDTGTRVARYLLQEFGGRVYKPLARTDWLPGTILATAAVVFSWSWFLWTGSVATIWPMFGAANQLLAGIALAVASSWLINTGRAALRLGDGRAAGVRRGYNDLRLLAEPDRKLPADDAESEDLPAGPGQFDSDDCHPDVRDRDHGRGRASLDQECQDGETRGTDRAGQRRCLTAR